MVSSGSSCDGGNCMVTTPDNYCYQFSLAEIELGCSKGSVVVIVSAFGQITGVTGLSCGTCP